jgi:c-di-GMP-binding flagellar brake protein YcgR
MESPEKPKQDKPENAPPPQPERRKESRQKVDGTAVLHLLETDFRLRGRILDLSMSGCQFRTQDCFPMRVSRRVEIEFQLEGLPFRIGGVTQSLHKKHIVGVRFHDMSERKRQQLVEIIVEIREMLALKAQQNAE